MLQSYVEFAKRSYPCTTHPPFTAFRQLHVSLRLAIRVAIRAVLFFPANCAPHHTAMPGTKYDDIPASRCTSCARTRGYPRRTARRGCPGRGRASGPAGRPATAASREEVHGLPRGLPSRTGAESRWERTCGGEQRAGSWGKSRETFKNMTGG